MQTIEKIKYSNEPDHIKRKQLLEAIKDFEPTDKLEAFYQFYDQLPVQGSEEWQKNRKIGASNIASILGICNFKKSYDVAIRMFSEPDYKKSLVTNWGIMFEPATKKFLKQYIKIYEFGSIPGFGEPIVTSCSPDGAFIMTQKMIDQLITNYVVKCDEIFLLEIKCPYSRFVKEIPTYYIPQLQMGMATLDITTGCAFCEFTIRACKMQDFDFTENCVHYYKQPVVTSPVLAIGVVYARTEKYETSFINNIMKIAPETNAVNSNGLAFVDYGNEDLEKTIHSATDFEYSELYYPFSHSCEKTETDKSVSTHSCEKTETETQEIMKQLADNLKPELFKNHNPEKKYVYGIIPYKIMDARMRAVKKENYQEVIDLVVKFANDVKKIGYNTVELKNYCDNFKPLYETKRICH